MNFLNWARENTHPDMAGWKPEALADVVALDLSFGSFAGLFASRFSPNLARGS